VLGHLLNETPQNVRALAAKPARRLEEVWFVESPPNRGPEEEKALGEVVRARKKPLGKWSWSVVTSPGSGPVSPKELPLVGLDYNSGYIATKARLAEKSLSSWVQDVLRSGVK
jgi:hypothetical protein